MSKKKCVVFDLDGTLVDSMSGLADIAQKVIQEIYDVSPLWARTQYQQTSGLPFPFQLDKIFPQDSRNSGAVTLFDDLKEKYYVHAPLFEDVKAGLHLLKSEGYHLAVSSNNDQALVSQKIEQFDLHFDMVMGFRPNFLKGADHFRWLFHCLGLLPSDTFMVGDSLHDGRLARQSGVSFVARLGTFSKTDFEKEFPSLCSVSSFEELPLLLAKQDSSEDFVLKRSARPLISL
ncbi:MAG: hypothetical protein A2048_07775 [Deltaproteobacteria bacterium GWA2_45_12]|nr:MAG: hypothetical protein A2048_07775 [Deltaproteobacteria bacterium GWA2_45_12]